MTLPSRDSLDISTIPMLHFYVAIKFSHRSLQFSVQVGLALLFSPSDLRQRFALSSVATPKASAQSALKV